MSEGHNGYNTRLIEIEANCDSTILCIIRYGIAISGEKIQVSPIAAWEPLHNFLALIPPQQYLPILITISKMTD